MAKILIAGGSGLIGSELKVFLKNSGHEVRVLSRTANANDPNRYVWDIESKSIDLEAFKNIDIVINLNGAGVLPRRWTTKRKKILRDSRIGATRLLVESIIQHKIQIKHFISASAMGYYGHSDRNIFKENADHGTGFLANLCVSWEREAMKLSSFNPVSITRIGLYLSPAGGTFALLQKLSKFYLAASIGSGKQWLGYTHRDEYNVLINALISNKVPSGTYNATGTEPVQMDQFVRDVADSQGKRVLLPRLPAVILKLALGEASEAILNSHKVSSEKMQKYNLHIYSDLRSSLRTFNQN